MVNILCFAHDFYVRLNLLYSYFELNFIFVLFNCQVICCLIVKASCCDKCQFYSSLEKLSLTSIKYLFVLNNNRNSIFVKFL